MTVDLELAPPRRVTVVESILEQMLALIRNGVLKPGDRLPSERRLIEMLGVSRASVREALQGLAAMDLIQIRPGEGTFVKAIVPPTNQLDIASLSGTLQKEMRLHLNETRLLLEREVVSTAAQRIDAKHRETIRQALAAYLQSDTWEADDHLHLTIAEATGNPILVRMLQNVLGLVPKPLLDRGFADRPPTEQEALFATIRDIHTGMAESVMRGDSANARRWMERLAENEEKLIENSYL